MAYDWTRVQYGRRGQRTTGTRTWQTYRGRASAPSVPFWAQNPNPQPNLPVPPSGSRSRYYGPQSRPYADAIRQNNDLHVPRHEARDRRVPTYVRNQYQPADPEFRKLIQSLHLVIKMVHHLQMVAPKPGKSEPVMISRMVETLSSVIKPAMPTLQTQDLILGNAKNWGYTTLLLLEDHYTAILEDILRELKMVLPLDWEPAFQVATRWARKNLPRITQEEIDHAEAMVTACEEPEVEEVVLHPPPAHFLEPIPPQPNLSPPTHTEQTAQGHAPTTLTVETMTGLEESPRRTMQEVQASLHDITPVLPRVQRTQRTLHHQVPTFSPEEVFHFTIGEARRVSPSPAQVAQGGASSMELGVLMEDNHNGLDNTPTLTPNQHQTPETRATGNPNSHQSAQSTPENSPGGNVTSPTQVVAPDQNLFKVRTHITTKCKMTAWSLNVEKKWLILGDSNLRSIPPYPISDLQIDTYPGANFRHASALMAKGVQYTKVEKLVLAFGLDHREQNGNETAIKQLQAAVRSAKRQFPYSEIWIPLINYSLRLPSRQRVTLQTLNDHITRNMGFIPALTGTQFQTEKDNVQWTKETAKAMYDHWVTFLNLHVP